MTAVAVSAEQLRLLMIINCLVAARRGCTGYGCNGHGTVNTSTDPFAAKNMNKRADRHGADATVPAVNGYTRFYSSGSLEICFLGLEEFDASADLQTLRGSC